MFEAGLAHIAVPSIGMVFCVLAGIYFTEPQADAGKTVATKSSSGYQESRVARWYRGYRAQSDVVVVDNRQSGSSSSGSGSSVDLDEGGEALALLLLIMLVLAAILASAVVPHFWMLGSVFCVTALVMIAVREEKFLSSERPSRY